MPQQRSAKTRDWPIIVGLLILSAIPALAGSLRLAMLAGSPEATPETARFVTMPLPVVLHIIGATLFTLLGALQFAPNLRRRAPRWHRLSGRVLLPAGIVAALSGMWMTHFYRLGSLQLQGPLLYGFRMLIGPAMVLCLILAWRTAVRRNIASHRAWVMRGYAIGQGAGTQALVLLPWSLLVSMPSGVTYDILLILGWVINLAVAEWIIRRKPRRQRLAQPQMRGQYSQ